MMQPVVLGRGDVFRHVMAAGGGFGHPLDRDPAAVLEDVREGRVTLEHARLAYGVVIDAAWPPRVDPGATAAERAALRAARDGTRRDAGPAPHGIVTAEPGR